MGSFTRLGTTFPLLFALATAASVAACSSTGEPSSPRLPTSEPLPTEPAPGGEVTEPGTDEPSTTPPMRDAIDPKILTALKTANIDIAKLPADLTDLTRTPSKLKAVMNTFTIALGTTCEGCHAKSGTKIDYEAETPKKNVAKKMWSELVGKLQRKDGTALYCDSCHQGKMKFLARADSEALGVWMENNFVGNLARRDGADHACATCHGEPFKGDILGAWRK